MEITLPNLLKFMSWQCLIAIAIQALPMQLLIAESSEGQSLSETRLSISADRQTLTDIFQQIEQRTKFVFVYPEAIRKSKSRFTLHATNESLQKILVKLKEQSNLKFKNIDYTITVAFDESYSEKDIVQRSITGIVTDEANQPLPGVNVIEKGTANGTSTDVDGKFTLRVQENNAAVIFSFIGYTTQEVPILNQSVMSIVLQPDVQSLSEVVVVAYGEQKKAAVTGSIATVQTRELVQSPVSNLTNALAGRLPGLITTQRSGEPGVNGSTFYIRGVSTLNTATPIVMVDGVERSMDYLDPNDIETISILKDAAATAVLGMRGANGAVLVTTKRGKVGPPQINFRSSIGVQTPTRVPEYLGSYEYATLYNEALSNDGAQLAFSPEDIEGYRNGTLPNTDYYKFILRPALRAQANLNVNGGVEKARYFISAGYNMEEGNYKYTKDNPDGYNTNNIMKRYSLRANVDVDLTENLSARLDLAGTMTARTDGNNSAADIMNMANRLPPIYPIFNEDGSLWGNGTYTQNIYGEISRKGYRVWYNNTVQGTFALSRKLDFITPNLTGRVSFSYDNTNTPNTSYGRSYALYQPVYNALGDVIEYAQYNSDTEIDPNGNFSGGDATRNTYFESTLNWNRQFGEHEATGMVLFNRRLQNSNSRIPYAYQSILFRGTYNYKTKYLLELSASYQGSENFPKESRYGLFPSLSAGWIISEESFFRNNVSFFDFLKIRASYGEVGNDRSGDQSDVNNRFLWFTSWSGADPYHFGTSVNQANGWAQGAVGNTNVTWERGRQFNVGIETHIWREKLTLTVDLFRQRRTKILTTRNTLSDVFGQSVKPQNIGVVDNKGFELELNHTNTVGAVHYFIKPNVTFARNKIVFQDEVPRDYPWMRRTGQPVNTQFGLIAEGFFKDEEDVTNSPRQNFSSYGPGDIKYKKLTGDEYAYVQNAFDETAIGYSRTPELIYGASAGIDYKGFDVSILFQGAGRTSVMLNNEAVYEFYQGGKVKPFHLGRWTPETANTATYPRLHSATHGNNHRASTFWLRDASYLRIKNAEIGYTLPRQWTSPIGFSYFRVYVNGMNLYTWDKLKDYGVDPEIDNGNGAMYPIQKTWNFGIDIRF